MKQHVSSRIHWGLHRSVSSAWYPEHVISDLLCAVIDRGTAAGAHLFIKFEVFIFAARAHNSRCALRKERARGEKDRKGVRCFRLYIYGGSVFFLYFVPRNGVGGRGCSYSQSREYPLFFVDQRDGFMIHLYECPETRGSEQRWTPSSSLYTKHSRMQSSRDF